MYDSIRHRFSDPQLRVMRRLSGLGTPFAIAALMPALVSAQTHPAGQEQPKPSPARQAATAPQPPQPDWPINAQAKPAAVTWNKQELSIDAANSSLQQILTDVASATGASVDGITKDERIFGTFGPAPARDVLAQLLQGTGYNVMMVGDEGQGLPRQIILSARSTTKTAPGGARPVSEESDDDIAPEVQYEPPPQPQIQPQQPPQQPMRPGFPPNPQQPGAQPPQGQQPNPQ